MYLEWSTESYCTTLSRHKCQKFVRGVSLSHRSYLEGFHELLRSLGSQYLCRITIYGSLDLLYKAQITI